MHLDDLPETLYFEKYEINENYRNARKITDYVVQNLHINMIPVGLNGIQKTVSNIPEIIFSDDDRIAVIVEDDSVILEMNIGNVNLNFFSQTNEIVRGSYNIIQVIDAKGLEFEKVIVIQEGMNKNQLYVACTRAISELYIVDGE